jgi:hypothetical protein
MFQSLDERTVSAGVLATAVLAGLFSPTLAQAAAPFALPALFLVVVFALIPFAELKAHEIVSIRWPVLRMLAWQQLLLPALVVSACIVMKLPDSWTVIAVVAASSGSLFASPALAEMLGLDRRRALQGMVLSTLCTPITLFAFLNLFRDAAIHVSLAGYTQRILIFLIIPFGLFAAYRWASSYLPRQAVTSINSGARIATILSLVVFCVGIMRAVSLELRHNPSGVAAALMAATVLCAVMMTLTAIVFYRFGRVEALTTGLLSGFRNVGLGYALVGDSLGHELAVCVGASMLPMFLAPFVLRLYHARQARDVPLAHPA